MKCKYFTVLLIGWKVQSKFHFQSSTIKFCRFIQATNIYLLHMEWLREKADALQERIRSIGGTDDDLEDEENQSLLQQLQEASTLNRTQRMLGFGVCFLMGMLLSMLSPYFILRPVKLATSLTLGNALSIGSMMFLMGPAKQCQSMMDSKRRTATLIYMGSLVLTLLAAFLVKSRLLCLVCIVVQYSALLWYSLSYIPYGQSMLLRVLPFGTNQGFFSSSAGADPVHG